VARATCNRFELEENGELASFVNRRRRVNAKAASMAIASLRKEVRRDLEAWLRAHMSILEARSGDPWVRDVLKALAISRRRSF
jgi:hypothetical protein